jgi:type II secretory pathway pseudopilin PulG
MRNRRHNFAFTLIELVLALAMVAILAVTLCQSLRIAFKSAAAAQTIIGPVRTSDLAMELIADDLQNVVLPAASTLNPNTSTLASVDSAYDLLDTSTNGTGTNLTLGANTNMTPGSSSSSSSSSSGSSTNGQTPMCLAGPFEGTQQSGDGGNEADDLVFFTDSDSPQHPDGDGEIKMVELTLAVPQGEKAPCLIRRVTGNLLPVTQQVDMDEEIICRNVTSLTFQYFDGTNWNTSWDSTQEDNDLPAAVQAAIVINHTGTDGKQVSQTFTRVFNLANSTAALDPEVNSGGTSQ